MDRNSDKSKERRNDYRGSRDIDMGHAATVLRSADFIRITRDPVTMKRTLYAHKDAEAHTPQDGVAEAPTQEPHMIAIP